MLEDRIEQGIPISRTRVARLMQAEALRARVRKGFRSTTTLDKAVKRRCPDAGLWHHSDPGGTYASEDYRTRLAQHGSPVQ